MKRSGPFSDKLSGAEEVGGTKSLGKAIACCRQKATSRGVPATAVP
jgi:hypothetical protein